MGAIAAVGAAVTAVAAEVGVAVAATALTVGFETIAAVGAVISVVGQVTHNKALSFAGLAIGAVGGIGALASSAGLLGAEAGTSLGEGATAGTDAASAGTIDSVAGSGFVDNTSTFTQAASEGATSAADATGAASGAGGFIDNTSTFAQGGDGVGLSDVAGLAKQGKGLIQAADSNAPAGNDHATGSAGGGTDSAIRSGGVASAVPLTQPPPGNTPVNTSAADAGKGPAPGVGGNTAATNPSNFVQDAQGNLTPVGAPAEASGGIGGAFSGLVDYAGKHPVVALGALQGAGSLLTGAFSTVTPAQTAALNAQAAANDAATALVKQQTANLAAPKAVASSAPVTGAPQQLVPPPTAPPPPSGFINQAPVQSPRITGVAA